MIRLLKIEFKKITTYKVFWVMIGIYLAALFFVFYGFPSLIDYFAAKSNSPEFKLLKNFLYNFPDIWQNLSWIASLRLFIKVLLAIIVIVLITNEYSYSTIRINIMNGLSRADFLKSKIYLIFFFSMVVTLFLIISVVILGLLFSPIHTFSAMAGKLMFVVGYFVETFSYLVFAFMIGLLVKRTGFAVSLLFVYPIIELIVQQKVPEKIRPYLPVNALNHIIRTPNTSVIQYHSPKDTIELQTFVAGQDILVALIYTAIFIYVCYIVLKKRDL